jgi:SNF2 family DNA or RNA helicase
MRTLYSHQRRALRKLPSTGGYLAFEQGLGKTVTAITYAQRQGATRVLVVAPAVALGVWANEFDAMGITWYTLPEGTRKQKAEQLPESGYAVVNYEVLLEPAFEKAVMKWKPDLIILDEAHKVKSASAKRSKVAHRLGKHFRTLLLSGTPITRNLLDLYSQYKVIDPNIWGGISWTRFRQTYGIWGGYGGYELIGYTNTQELKDKIAPWTVVARKEDTLDLPPKTFTPVPVSLGRYQKDYMEMAREGANDEWVTTNPLEKALRLSQIAGRAKLSATVELVQEFREQGEQVVVYARYLDELEALSEELGVPALTGSTKAADRGIMVEQFQSGELDVFLSQITAGSTGITLTAASHMIYHSMTFSYEDWSQSQDRIHRIGQTRPANYWIMETKGPKGGMTIDGLVLKALQNKEDVAAMVTADPSLLLPKEA